MAVQKWSNGGLIAVQSWSNSGQIAAPADVVDGEVDGDVQLREKKPLAIACINKNVQLREKRRLFVSTKQAIACITKHAHART